MWRWYIRHTSGWPVNRRLNALVDAFLQSWSRDFVTTTAWGGQFQGNTREILQRYLYLYGVWEPNLTAWLSDRLSRGDVFVDVGANIGYYSVLSAKRIGPDGHVVAIEPFPNISAALRAHIDRNGLSNVRVLNEAVLDRAQDVELFQALPSNMAASSIINIPGYRPAGMIRARTLAEILTPDEIRRARIIKIDVEGSEIEAVRSLIPILSEARDDCELVVEVGGALPPAPSAGAAYEQIYRLLKPFGFHCYQLLNPYEAAAYLSRARVVRPWRLRGGVEKEADLIFSRIDADSL